MKANDDQTFHTPVMPEEVLDYLSVSANPRGTFLDATIGTGGHARQIVDELSASGTLIGLDVDHEALNVAQQRLKDASPEVRLYHLNYVRIDELVQQESIEGLQGVLFDFGVSSPQLDDPQRGFSFLREGPLDMRMDREADKTARDLVSGASWQELVELLRKYGEERWATRIAQSIISNRQDGEITKTTELADIVEEAIPAKSRYSRSSHPATRTFQALRIAVNEELKNVKEGLNSAFPALNPGGALVALSYHSLEDRIVKRFIREKEKTCVCPPELPVCRCDKEKEAQSLTGGPLRASSEEVKNNSRARSAKLRAAEKL